MTWIDAEASVEIEIAKRENSRPTSSFIAPATRPPLGDAEVYTGS